MISKYLLLVLTSFIFLFQAPANAQTVSGKVVSQDDKKPIPYATIKLTDGDFVQKVAGVSADEYGVFTFGVLKFPVIIEITSVGYESKKLTLKEAKMNLVIELKEASISLNEVVVSGEKISQEELRSPIQIERLSMKELKNTASFNFFDAVTNLKGVDVATQSIIINTVNTRGFNSNTNLRFRQFTDGIDSQAPGLGFSLGNIVGPSGLDIESLELIPGPTTSKYGNGAFNGVLDMKTKNPFDYQGLSLEVKGASLGTDPYDDKFISLGTDFITEGSFRYAKAIKKKVAFKVNGSILTGVDYAAKNYKNIGPGAAFEKTHSTSNQGINVVNHYGDDRAAQMVLPVKVISGSSAMNGITVVSPNDTAFAVTREGYREEDLVEYNSHSVKLNGALHFKLTKNSELSLSSFYGKASTMITGDDRIALRDFSIQQHKVELNVNSFNFRAYTTMQDAGDTYNVGRLAESIIQTAKPDAEWFAQYQRLYEGGRGGFQAVRKIADSAFPGQYLPRFKPGTQEFDSLKSDIISSINPRYGAKIYDKSKLYHVEASTKLNAWESFFDNFEVGASARLYDPESAGTIFTDSIGNDVTNFEAGAFVEMSHRIDKKTEATASFRVDKNENFNLISSQRISAVKEIRPNNFLRGSLQRGQRLPNIREQFFNQNLGDLTIVGGLPEVVGQYDLRGNAILQNAVESYNQTISDEVNDILKQPNQTVNVENLRLKHLGIIENGIVGMNKFRGIKPETITSAEFGFKSLVEGKRLIEAILYVNHYHNFIGVTRVIKPRTSPLTDLRMAAEQANSPGSSDQYYISDNSSKPIITQGLELLYDVTSNGGTNFIINMTFANIIQKSNDSLTPGFNTPPFKLNMTLGHDNMAPNFGAKISWRFRSSYAWESNFVDGEVPDYNTFDFQFTYKIPTIKTAIRFGGNNVLNQAQFNAFGGPEITAFYYMSLTFDPF
ncbi:TonB-dependent receptor [Roseivirga echinicomitans]